MGNKRRRKPKNPIDEQFYSKRRSMLEAPAYRVLSLAARRVLDRIILESMRHAGKDNGSLPVSYEQFVEYGIERGSIPPALRELEALGFIKIKRGRAGNSEFRTPNKFTLTCLWNDKDNLTDDWKKIETVEKAKRIQSVARREMKATPPKKSPVGETHTVTVGETPTEKTEFHSGKTHTNPVGESRTTF